MIKITIEDLDTGEVTDVTGKLVSAFIIDPESGMETRDRVPDVITVLKGAGSPVDMAKKIAACLGVIITKFYRSPKDRRTIASEVMEKFIDGVTGEGGEMEITKWGMIKADEVNDDEE